MSAYYQVITTSGEKLIVDVRSEEEAKEAALMELGANASPEDIAEVARMEVYPETPSAGSAAQNKSR